MIRTILWGSSIRAAPYAGQSAPAKTLVIGIGTDILFPVEEQQYIASHVKDAKFVRIESSFGHDGFLLEYEQLEKLIGSFTKLEKIKKETLSYHGNS